MKILVVSQYYHPEPFRISDICEGLVRRGHAVTVVTGLPNYPMGEIYEGYRHGKKRDEVINGVKVYRCFTVGRRKGIFFRFLNYYSYMFSSVSYVRKLQERFDVVFVNQLSPVMMAKAGIVYKKKNKVPLVLYCLDLWPVSLAAGGIDKGKPFYRYFRKVSGEIYKEADKLLITSRSFADYFRKEFGITGAEYLPQYAEDVFDPKLCRKEADGYVDLMFAGNVGYVQSVETIIEAAKKTADVKKLRWHIVGDGAEIDRIKAMAKGMEQVLFHGRKPLEEMPAYYAMADAMLVTMRKDPVLSLTLPGKVQTYLAAGKAIIGAIDGEAARVIRDADCGFCGPAEDAGALAENVRKFLYTDRDTFESNAGKYYEEQFGKEKVIDMLESAFAAGRKGGA